MADTAFAAGATSKIVTVEAITISTGLPYTAGLFNTATINATYTRLGSTPTTITLVTATAGAYTSSGFVHRGKGVYEIGAPTLALAASADAVDFAVDGIADVLFRGCRVELMGANPRSATADANVTTINGQTATAAAAVTFPSSVASPTNITAATGVTLAAVTHTGAVIPNVTTTGTATTVATVTALSGAANIAIADAILDRDMATGTDSGTTIVRTMRQALRTLRNRFVVSAGTVTVYKEDDATASFTAVVTGTTAVTAVDPAGP
jgi:hypothetical protein